MSKHPSQQTAATVSSGTLSIRRSDRTVRIDIICGDEYAAIELFEKAVDQAKRGSVSLTMVGGAERD